MAAQVEFFQPHEEAAAILRSKPAVTRAVFDKLLPELRARAITVTGLEGLNQIERIRAEIEDFTRGQTTGGEPVTWNEAKQRIADTLAAAFGSEEAAATRATLLLRTHAFQAYQAANWRVAQEDDDTTHLQYLATEDDRVRDSHLALNGIILPKDDPFWNDHFPPWDWGCRCRVRPINPDLLELERARDLKRKPEDRLVLEGPALEKLRQGQITRGELRDRNGRVVSMGTHDVTAPAARGEPGAYQWHPDNLRLDAKTLRARYSEDEWKQFTAWARRTKITPDQTVLDWIENT
jgi:SPP1 gp7 family putative phage head morphogenesis protein